MCQCDGRSRAGESAPSCASSPGFPRSAEILVEIVRASKLTVAMANLRDIKRDSRDGEEKIAPQRVVQRTRELTTEAHELHERARNLRRVAQGAEQRAREMFARAEEMRDNTKRVHHSASSRRKA